LVNCRADGELSFYPRQLLLSLFWTLANLYFAEANHSSGFLTQDMRSIDFRNDDDRRAGTVFRMGEKLGSTAAIVMDFNDIVENYSLMFSFK